MKIKLKVIGLLFVVALISFSFVTMVYADSEVTPAVEVNGNVLNFGTVENGWYGFINQGVEMERTKGTAKTGEYSLYCSVDPDNPQQTRGFVKADSFNPNATYIISADTQRAENVYTTFAIGFIFNFKDENGESIHNWPQHYWNLGRYVSTGSYGDWDNVNTHQEGSLTISYDNSTHIVTVDGDNSQTYNGVYDMDVYVSIFMGNKNSMYIDNITIIEQYDGSVTVKDDSGNNVNEDVTFKILDAYGENRDIVPDESENGKYIFKDLKGNVTITPTINGEVRPAVNLSGTARDAVSETFTSVITLVDENEQPVVGAVVQAYAKNSLIGDFTDNNDGTYTLSGLEGVFTVFAEKEGLFFEKRVIDVDSKNITLKGSEPDYKDVINVANNLIYFGTYEEDIPKANEKLQYQGAQISYARDEYYEGVRSLKVSAITQGQLVDANRRVMIAFANLLNASEEGTEYHFETWAKTGTEENTNLIVGILGVYNKPTEGYTHTWALVNKPVDKDWTLISFDILIKHIKSENKVMISINGGQEVVYNDCLSIARASLVLGVQGGNAAYVDSTVLLQKYVGEVKVLDSDGNSIEDVEFTVKDFKDQVVDITPVYENGTYKFAGLYGLNKIVAKKGATVYPEITVSVSDSVKTIEQPYTVIVTLKDSSGNYITGATVIAKQGIAKYGDFTDNGDGTYTLSNVMGVISIEAEKEGYIFQREMASVSDSAVLMIGEKEASQPSEKTGCSSNINSNTGYIAIVIFAFTVMVTVRKLKFKK